MKTEILDPISFVKLINDEEFVNDSGDLCDEKYSTNNAEAIFVKTDAGFFLGMNVNDGIETKDNESLRDFFISCIKVIDNNE